MPVCGRVRMWVQVQSTEPTRVPDLSNAIFDDRDEYAADETDNYREELHHAGNDLLTAG